jgi:hypothetical protein
MPAPEPEIDDTLQRIGATAAALRAALVPLLHHVAGQPPRPVRLTRGLGLDKSLASRLVQATRAGTDAGLLHAVPSPTGLRILIERARGHAEVTALEQAVDDFDALLATLPGGRQALDARLGAGAAPIHERREQIARQASFKAVSFLFGHYCETLTTALVVTPSARRGWLDFIEVHRRIGLQRVVPGAALPLLSVLPQHPGQKSRQAAMADLAGREDAAQPSDFILAEGSDAAADVRIEREGGVSTFVLGGAGRLPARLTTGLRILRAERRDVETPHAVLRTYMLHLPCRTLVRDVFVDDAVWPDARPLIDFYLPGPSGSPPVQATPGQPHLRRLNLTARIEQLPAGAAALELADVADQRPTLESAFARAGVDAARLRGWRCRMAYPLPLVEMQIALRFGSKA